MGKDIQLYKSVPFEMHDEQYLTKDYALELKNKGIDIEVGMGLDLDDKKSYKFFIDQLKKIKSTLDSCGVKAEDTRIHCPLGFKYEYWIDRPVPVEEVDSKFVDKYKPNKFKDKGGKEYYITNNYNFLKEVAENIFSLGFKGIVIHTPHGSSNVKEEEDFKKYKK